MKGRVRHFAETTVDGAGVSVMRVASDGAGRYMESVRDPDRLGGRQRPEGEYLERFPNRGVAVVVRHAESRFELEFADAYEAEQFAMDVHRAADWARRGRP